MQTTNHSYTVETENIIITPQDKVIFHDKAKTGFKFDCEVQFCEETSQGEKRYNIFIEDFEEFCRNHQGFKIGSKPQGEN